VEGECVTDPDFLDDPVKLFRGSRASVRLDDPEKLFQESVKESFAWWRPKKLRCDDSTPCISNLVAHRWRRPPFSPDEELDAVRRIQSADICGPLRFHRFDDFAKLLAGFHGKVLQVANGHMPSRWRQRLALRDKHTNNLLFEDLVGAGVGAMWKAALKFDLEAGYRFWTGVRAPVLGAISDEARRWRRSGSGETRLDRWLYAHPEASPEQVLRAQERLVKRPVFHSLQEAAEGIKQFWAWGSEPEAEWDDDVFPAQNWCYLAEILREWYDCFDPYQLSSHRRIHERFGDLVDRLSGGLDTGPDVGNASRPKKPRDLLDYTETAFIQFKNGKRQVARQKAASYCYGIVVSPELQTRAKKDLEFAKARWESRIKRAPLPAQTYPRWSTIGGLKCPDEYENKQIVPAYIPGRNEFEWKVEYRSGEGNVLSVLESPYWHCLKPKPCEFCEAERNRSRTNNVPRLSILSAA
jgi:hypothetical protein